LFRIFTAFRRENSGNFDKIDFQLSNEICADALTTGRWRIRATRLSVGANHARCSPLFRFSFCSVGRTRFFDGSVPEVAGLLPWNVSYGDSSPGTSDNRTWSIGWYPAIGSNTPYSGSPAGHPDIQSGGLQPGWVEGGVNATGAHAGDHTWKDSDNLGGTYIQDILRFKAGDRIRVRNSTSATNFYTTVVSVSASQIQFADNVGSGDVIITKYLTGRVWLVQGATRYELMPVRDYSVAFNSPGANISRLNMILTSSAEANVGAATFNPGNEDYILCTLDGGGLVQAYINSGFYYDGLTGMLLRYLENFVGVSTANIDYPSFESFAETYDDYQTLPNGNSWVSSDAWNEIGLMPNDPGAAFPNHTEILSKILVAAKAVLFYGPDEKVRIRSLELGTSVGTIDLERRRKTLSIAYDFGDVDNVFYDKFISEIGII
jgi:hypothetical protein